MCEPMPDPMLEPISGPMPDPMPEPASGPKPEPMPEPASDRGVPISARPPRRRAPRPARDGAGLSLLNHARIPHERRHPDRRRRGRHPRARRRHPGGRGPSHPHGRHLRRGAGRHRGAAPAPRLPRHLAAGQPARRAAGARRRQGAASGPAGGDDLRPRQHRDRGLGHQGRAPTTSSRSRSRPTASCSSPSARSRPRGSSARSRTCGRARSRRAGSSAAPSVGQPAAPDARARRADQRPRPGHRRAGGRQGARGAHPARRSRRARAGPSWCINAATITPENMEAELFGVEGGEGNGRRVGALEEAHGGTLYIDEIADMPRETQSRILRVLVDQNFQRVGGAHPRPRRRAHHLLVEPRPRRRDRGRALPRGPVPPPERRADPRSVAVRAARGRAGADRLLHGPDLGRDGPAEAPHRRRRHGGAPDRTTGPATSASCATTSSG